MAIDEEPVLLDRLSDRHAELVVIVVLLGLSPTRHSEWIRQRVHRRASPRYRRRQALDQLEQGSVVRRWLDARVEDDPAIDHVALGEVLGVVADIGDVDQKYDQGGLVLFEL